MICVVDAIEKLMVPLAQPRKVKLVPFGQIPMVGLAGKEDGVTSTTQRPNHWAMVY